MNARKLLKLFLTLASFVWYLCYVVLDDKFTLIQIPTALAIASSVYLLCSLYGFAVDVSRNYLLATILSVATIFLLMKPLDMLSEWLSEDIVLVIIMVLTIPFVIKDIKSFVGTNEKSSVKSKKSDNAASNDNLPSVSEEDGDTE